MPWPVERFQAFDEILEVGNHFWRAAGQIDRRDVGFREPIDHPIDRLSRHEFLSLRSSIHMAVNTSEVTEFADINLQDLRLGMTQRERVLG